MWIDGVFSGGGVKAYAFVGAIEVVEQSGLHFKRVAGTSAGSIIASLLAAGYKSHEIRQELEQLDPSVFLDQAHRIYEFPLLKWISVYWRMGLYTGKTFENWIKELLAKKGIHRFSDLPPNSLKIIASDVSHGKLLLLPDDLPQYGINPDQFSVARAVRMSSSLPFFFEPYKLKSEHGKPSLILDGGVVSNFPFWVFKEQSAVPSRPILGFQLSSKEGAYPNIPIKNAIQLFQNLFLTMKEAHDAKYISNKEINNIMFIPVDEYLSENFNLSKSEQVQLMEIGRRYAAQFLKKWTY